jgi:DNA-binding GntR family transcriptional regulator
MIPNLERTGPVPIYKQIEDWMREQILSGKWVEHYKLMSEIDLAQQLDVNRGTVRKATDTLIGEGLLVRIHGRGTFVSSRTLEQPLAERLMTFSEDLISKSIPFRTIVIEKSIIQPPPRIASLLSVTPETPVFFLRRLRELADETQVLIHNYVVYPRCPGVEDYDFTQQRLFEILEGRYSLQLDWGRRDFEAQAANEEIAQQIDVAPGSPVMYMQQLVYLADGSPIETSEMWIAGSRFRLSSIVKRDGLRKSASSLHSFVSPS